MWVVTTDGYTVHLDGAARLWIEAAEDGGALRLRAERRDSGVVTLLEVHPKDYPEAGEARRCLDEYAGELRAALAQGQVIFDMPSVRD